MSAPLSPYNREKAVAYAQTWAKARNPRFYDYSAIGGDCTNFISQCILAGGGIMNHTPTFGWYYIDANRKAPAWTGVPYLYNFLTRTTGGPGPVGQDAEVSEMTPGDIIQLAFRETGAFGHSLIVVKAGQPAALQNILINTHSYDRKEYPLAHYFYSRIRFIKIIGVRRG